MANHFKAEAEASDGRESNSDVAAESDSAASSNKDRDGKQKRKGGPHSRNFPSVQHPDDPAHEIPADVPSHLNAKAKKKARKRNARKSQKTRDAERAERLRWEQSQHYTRAGTVKGYLSYTCKVYLVRVSLVGLVT